MPSYWQWLYRPKTQGQTEQDKIMRRLSFKLPVVIRYNFLVPGFFGIIAMFITKRVKSIFLFYKLTPITIPALCYEQIYRYYLFKQGLPPPEVVRNSQADLMIQEAKRQRQINAKAQQQWQKILQNKSQ